MMGTECRGNKLRRFAVHSVRPKKNLNCRVGHLAMIRFHGSIPASIAGNLFQAVLYEPSNTFPLKTRGNLAKIMQCGESSDLCRLQTKSLQQTRCYVSYTECHMPDIQ
ncbi:MAG: hypothetical protein DDT34_02040 [Firmicutes bacterium]|nr:hypothetical protein [Bacillota bacterium]